MYFINTRNKLKSNAFLLHLLPASTVLVTVLGLTLLGWRNANQAYQTEKQSVINSGVSESINNISDKLNAYKLVLTGSSGLFVSSDTVSRVEWQKFVTTFDLPNNYPGVKGVGYLTLSTEAEAPSIISSIQSDGFPNARLHPDTKTDEYAILTYFVPDNFNGLGYNMLTHPARKAAISTANKTGKATISDKILYTKTEMPFGGVGFSMYLPVYRNDDSQNVSSQNIRGYVITPILANEFFDKIFTVNKNEEKQAIRIYDASLAKDGLLYASPHFASLDNDKSEKYSAQMDLFGQKWILDFRFSPDIVPESTRNRPISSLIIGSMLSILLSGFVLTLLIARTRVLAHSKQLEIQSAKDELLSLASHQLRTPATSVKQYLGMTLEGFAGKIAPQQKTLLEKAYESNERQLHIINEILYVAKIDAKGIVLTPRRININKLLRELSQELSATAKKSRQKIRLQMPKKQTYIEADEHCLRMVIENLLSNAIKYSYDGTTVSVKLAATSDQIFITVKDRGVGIDSEDIPLLFQRFSRIPNELTQQTSGSGIGLYLSQQLIELHNGKIEVESTKGKGTIFTVVMPKIYKPKSVSGV